MTYPSNKEVEKKVRYEIEDFFDNAERRGDKYSLEDGRWLGEKMEDAVLKLRLSDLDAIIEWANSTKIVFSLAAQHDKDYKNSEAVGYVAALSSFKSYLTSLKENKI